MRARSHIFLYWLSHLDKRVLLTSPRPSSLCSSAIRSCAVFPSICSMFVPFLAVPSSTFLGGFPSLSRRSLLERGHRLCLASVSSAWTVCGRHVPSVKHYGCSLLVESQSSSPFRSTELLLWMLILCCLLDVEWLRARKCQRVSAGISPKGARSLCSVSECYIAVRDQTWVQQSVDSKRVGCIVFYF